MAGPASYICRRTKYEYTLESTSEPDGSADIKIAIVGEAKSGKSSFIKAIMRNNKMETEGTGVLSPTSKPECYAHPENPNIKLWDLPGLGTAAYPDTKTYFEKLKLGDQYHAFLLFTRGRLTLDSQRLAIRLESTQRPFLFIRSCIDVDVKSERMTKPGTFNENNMIEDIRKDILEGLKDLDYFSSERPIFLISNVKPKKWDFCRLNNQILYDLPIDKSSLPSSSTGFLAQLQHKLARLSLKERQEKFHSDEDASFEYIKRSMPEKTGIKREGITRAQKLMKEELEGWKTINISLAIIGNSGVGKSSFINAIRGITDFDDPNAAKTGTTETTMTPQEFHYPDNPNITLWDCPGVGTAAFPDIERYCDQIHIEKYDAFVIMTATRFSEQAGVLATKLEAIKKPFFFARTKIDQDYISEHVTKRSTFNEVTMLDEIKEECFRNLKLKEVEIDDNDIFLISNLYARRWDFARLTEAINNRMHSRKRECFLLSMLSLSENILKKKVEFLKGRVFAVAFFQSMIMKPFMWKENSRKRDFQLIVTKVKHYRSQLGFPKQDSEEFGMLSDVLKEKVRKFYLTGEIDVEAWLNKFYTENDDKDSIWDGVVIEGDDEESRREEETLSWLDVCAAIKAPYGFVYNSLHCVLDEMEKIAVEILNETAAKSQPSCELDLIDTLF